MRKLASAIFAICIAFTFIKAQDSISVSPTEKPASDSYAAERISQFDQDSRDTGNEQKIKLLDGRIEYSSHNASATVSGSEGETVTIYNLSGKAVLEKKIDSDSLEISLSGLGKGVYLLRLGARTAKVVL